MFLVLFVVFVFPWCSLFCGTVFLISVPALVLVPLVLVLVLVFVLVFLFLTFFRFFFLFIPVEKGRYTLYTDVHEYRSSETGHLNAVTNFLTCTLSVL